MTDEEALAEIRNGLDKIENFRRFGAENDAFAYIEARLTELREREAEDADPHCSYCGVRRSSHQCETETPDPKACMVFTTGDL